MFSIKSIFFILLSILIVTGGFSVIHVLQKNTSNTNKCYGIKCSLDKKCNPTTGNCDCLECSTTDPGSCKQGACCPCKSPYFCNSSGNCIMLPHCNTTNCTPDEGPMFLDKDPIPHSCCEGTKPYVASRTGNPIDCRYYCLSDDTFNSNKWLPFLDTCKTTKSMNPCDNPVCGGEVSCPKKADCNTDKCTANGLSMYPSATEGPYSCCDPKAKPYSAQTNTDKECTYYCLTDKIINNADLKWTEYINKCGDSDAKSPCSNPVCGGEVSCPKVVCNTDKCTANGVSMYPSVTEGPYSCCDSNAKPYSAKTDTDCSLYCLTANNLSTDTWKTSLAKCNTSIDDDSMYMFKNPVCDTANTICAKTQCKTDKCTANGVSMYPSATDGPYSCCDSNAKPYSAKTNTDTECSLYCLTANNLSTDTWKTSLANCNTVDDSMSVFSNSVCDVGGTICTKITCRTEHCTGNGDNMYLTTDGTTVGPYSCCEGTKPYMAKNEYDTNCSPYCLSPNKFSDPTWTTRLEYCGITDDSMDSMSAFSNSVCGIDETKCPPNCKTTQCEQGGKCNPDNGKCEPDSQRPDYWDNGFGYCNNNQPTKFWGCHFPMSCYSDNTCHQSPTECTVDIAASNEQKQIVYSCNLVPLQNCVYGRGDDGDEKCTPDSENMYPGGKACCQGFRPTLLRRNNECEWICKLDDPDSYGPTPSIFNIEEGCTAGPWGGADPYFRPCIDYAQHPDLPVPVMPIMTPAPIV